MSESLHSRTQIRAAVRSLTDVLEIEQTPWRQCMPARNTYDLLCQACERHPDRTALRFLMNGDPAAPEFPVTYRDLRCRVTQAANAFHRAGISRGKAVSLLLPNLPQTHYALLGAQAAGIASPINPMLEAEHIAGIVNETGAEVLVALAPLPGTDIWNKAMDVVDKCPGIRVVFAVSSRQYLDQPGKALIEDMFTQSRKPKRSDVSIVEFDTALDAERSDRLVSAREFDESDVCSYFHTGGTTGLPKIAAHTHLNEAFVAWALGAILPTGNVLLCGLPLFHVNGAMVTGLAAFHSGAEVVMLTPSGYRGQGVLPNFWKLVERFKATSFSAVPTIYAALADLPIGDADISSLRYAVCGAAPLPSEVARRFEAASGVQLFEGYGLTEGACVSSCNPPLGERRLGTVGLRLPHQQMKAWKIDSSGNATEECCDGEVGVIGICGPNVFPGYLRHVDNQDIWLKPGWLNTGDLGYFDKDGYLHLTGRAKELIIRGGHNIDPVMIEDAILKLPEVASVAAVGQPDEHAGELPVAYVTIKPGHLAVAGQLLIAARELVPERAAIPVHIEILEQMPLTAIGKVAKAELRLRAAERVFQQLLAARDIPAKVQVRTDIKRGTTAFIECTVEHAAKVHELLGHFAIPIELSPPGL
ncbi:acyl-CoA synthetase [Undibacterium sp.]|jgi:fatty-acyl-CoA synthase|uniref:acyl-CoA synthetase n=1 Tax=Undibacterium sp. TaxID=1914977 RepID=UPI002CBB0A21|nr:acyl-CoA synthetase [Undibacterium sp.]HTD05830.1 acyl-CoA synthetase [Undibacterium sp.]